MTFTGPHYTKPDHWTPRHYGDELHEEGLEGRDASVTLLTDDVDPSDRRACYRADVRCPCGRKRPAAVLVDCRHLPADVTDGQPWACDACWSAWIRPDGRTALGRIRIPQRLSEAEWVALHGAPRAHVARFRQVAERRKGRGWQIGHRMTDRLDLDRVTESADDPRELPPLPERPEGKAP